MTRFLLSAFAVLLLSQATPESARAQEPDVITVDPVKAGLVKRYFDAINMDKLMMGLVESMVTSTAMDSTIPAEHQKLIQEVAIESFQALQGEMNATYVTLYAEAFTVEELRGLVEFYESPVGRALMAKTLGLTQRAGEIYEQFQPRMEAEMLRRICERIDCKADDATR